MWSHSSRIADKSIFRSSNILGKYSPADPRWPAIITLLLVVFSGLPGLLSAQSSPGGCAPQFPPSRAVPSLSSVGTPNRSEVPDLPNYLDPADHVTADFESTRAATPLNCPPSGPATHWNFRSSLWLRDAARLDRAAIDEGWLKDNQQAAGMPFGREDLQPRLTLRDNFRISQMCDSGEIPRRECRMHWGKAFLQTLEITVIDNAWNIGTDKWVRKTVFNEPDFFGNWFQSVENFQWGQWSNGDWWVAEYVGHPMQGAIYSYIWIQNDPWGKSLEFENNWRYWRSRLRSLPWSIFWIFEWRFGPLGEAALGNYGLDKILSEFTHSLTWGTGVVTLVTTPVGGLVEVVGEDAIDKYFIKKLENRYSNPLVLFGLSAFTPTRSMANLMRFKAPWYRDSRTVKAWMHKNRAARSVPEGENSSPQ